MKSKIEEKIKNAREATNEMFAAFEELNKSLSNPVICEIRGPRSWDIVIRDKMEEQRKWMPKRGEYVTIKYNFNGETHQQYICIIKDKLDKTHYPFAAIDTTGKLHIGRGFYFNKGDVACPSNQQERQLLDDKLKESGKRFDKEKLELVDIPKFKEGDYFVLKMGRDKDGLRWLSSMESYIDKILIIDKISENGNIINKEVGYYFHPDWCEKTTAPKHKEPIIGEMAIFWDTDNKKAFCATLNSMINGRYSPDGNIRFDNAILFESPEQYKAFLKS